jgi:hypothetical protein
MSGSSAEYLQARLPALAPFKIESCRYTVRARNTSRQLDLPSPSDICMELAGRAVLSNDGFAALRARYAWKHVSRTSLPPDLQRIAPRGRLLVSQALNAAFRTSGQFPHVYAVIPEDGHPPAVFFLAQDLDHPIQSSEAPAPTAARGARINHGHPSFFRRFP